MMKESSKLMEQTCCFGVHKMARKLFLLKIKILKWNYIYLFIINWQSSFKKNNFAAEYDSACL